MLSWQERRCLTSMSGGKHTIPSHGSYNSPPPPEAPISFSPFPLPVSTLHPARYLARPKLSKKARWKLWQKLQSGSNHKDKYIHYHTCAWTTHRYAGMERFFLNLETTEICWVMDISLNIYTTITNYYFLLFHTSILFWQTIIFLF